MVIRSFIESMCCIFSLFDQVSGATTTAHLHLGFGVAIMFCSAVLLFVDAVIFCHKLQGQFLVLEKSLNFT